MLLACFFGLYFGLHAAKPEFEMAANEEVEWSDLPDDVVAKIQAQLPLVSLVQSRAVCNAWNSAVASRFLHQERLQSRGGSPERLLFVLGFSESRITCCVYDSASDRWRNIQLPPWQQSVKVPDPPTGRTRRLYRVWECEQGLVGISEPSSASGGLLISTDSNPAEKISVPHFGNPVAGSWASLPPFPAPNLTVWDVRGVFVDAIARCFKLVVVQDPVITPVRATGSRAGFKNVGLPISTFVFDSSSWRWMKTTRPQPLRKSFADMQQGVFVDTVLYCLSEVCDLLVFNLEDPRWRRVKLARPRVQEIFYCTLVKVRERLMCLAVCVEREVQKPCLQFWELDLARKAWTAVDHMPGPIFDRFRVTLRHRDEKFSYKYFSRIKVVAGQDSEVFIMQNKRRLMVSVDLGQRPGAWRWLPKFPYKEFRQKTMHCLDPLLEFGSWNKDHQHSCPQCSIVN